MIRKWVNHKRKPVKHKRIAVYLWTVFQNTTISLFQRHVVEAKKDINKMDHRLYIYFFWGKKNKKERKNKKEENKLSERTCRADWDYVDLWGGWQSQTHCSPRLWLSPCRRSINVNTMNMNGEWHKKHWLKPLMGFMYLFFYGEMLR